MQTEKGCVYLIGAGCGKADLITLRGLNRLQQCDVIVYDDLIDPRLLQAAPAGTPAIYMGKRQGKHSAQQQEISDTLVKLAQQGKRVARLKGGDPFVFGRGGEEAMALQAAGIPFEEVPGISSCIAIPAMAGIPVTHRGISRSFHVVTAHTQDGDEELCQKMQHLAALDGTLVFLMGLSRLETVVQGLVQAGKSLDTPAAVVSGGNAPHPAVVRGTLKDVVQRVREAQVMAPAVIVVGETAAMNLLDLASAKPLSGVRVGVTGTVQFTEKLCDALEKQGAQTIIVQQSRVEELAWHSQLEQILDGGHHWLVFTSANGVTIFFKALRGKCVDLRRLARCKFAVIGCATGKALEEYGFQADLCPDQYNSRALAVQLCEAIVPGEDAVLLRAKTSAKILPDLLREQGINAEQVALYDVKAEANAGFGACSVLDELDYITFASAGGVHQFFAAQRGIPDKTVCVCIGDETAKAFSQYDGRACLVAENASIESMVQKIRVSAVCPEKNEGTLL